MAEWRCAGLCRAWWGRVARAREPGRGEAVPLGLGESELMLVVCCSCGSARLPRQASAGEGGWWCSAGGIGPKAPRPRPLPLPFTSLSFPSIPFHPFPSNNFARSNRGGAASRSTMTHSFCVAAGHDRSVFHLRARSVPKLGLLTANRRYAVQYHTARWAASSSTSSLHIASQLRERARSHAHTLVKEILSRTGAGRAAPHNLGTRSRHQNSVV
ncbi:hypothetical protein E2C01_053424 [Portunus trituberculatus]|uniref:Uncharacterized protein n=1 Tax=Portunus trituberculatus TaxID=210409 RepID=A0A5B7GS07_PORTR|nr:hypothetical protein [Portunus trituberculatus]